MSRRRVVVCAVFVALIAVSKFAAAQTPSVSLTSTGGTVLAAPLNSVGSDFSRLMAGSTAGAGDRLGSDPTFSRLMQRPSTLGDVAVMDRATASVLGKPTTMGITRIIPWGAVAKSMAKALPYVGTAAAIYDAYKTYRTYKDPASNSDVLTDDGQPSQQMQTWHATCFNGSADGSSPVGAFNSACAAGAALNTTAQYSYLPPTNATCTLSGSGSSATCTGDGTVTHAGLTFAQTMNGGASLGTSQACPATIDALNPANSRAAGSAVDADGKCPTGRYSAQTFVDAAAKLATADALKALAAKYLQDSLNATPTAAPDNFPTSSADPDTGAGLSPTQAPGTLSGPDSVAGAPTSSTTTPPAGSPAGTPSTTTTSTPTAAVSYTTNTWNTTITTVINNGNGTTTTTTAPPPPDVKTDCDKHPTDLACTELGAPPVAETMPTQAAPISYSPTDFANPGGCPAEISFAFSLAGHSYSYTLDAMSRLCALASSLRSLFLALFAASAAIIFYQGLASQKIN